MDPRLEDVKTAARAQGWRVETDKKGYTVFYPKNKDFPPIRWAATPSDWRAPANNMSKLRRAGLIWPWPPKK